MDSEFFQASLKFMQNNNITLIQQQPWQENDDEIDIHEEKWHDVVESFLDDHCYCKTTIPDIVDVAPPEEVFLVVQPPPLISSHDQTTIPDIDVAPPEEVFLVVQPTSPPLSSQSMEEDPLASSIRCRICRSRFRSDSVSVCPKCAVIFENNTLTHRPRLQCSLCDFQSLYQKTLARHTERNHALCVYCDVYFEGGLELTEHLWRDHSDKIDWRETRRKFDPYPYFRCRVCFVFTSCNKTAIREHKNGHLPVLKCHKCGSFSTTSKRSFARHNDLHHARLNCAHCNFFATKRDSMEDHLVSRHVWHRCSLCSYKHRNEENLDAHVAKMHSLVRCDDCPFSCVGSDRLTLHRRETHSVKCPKCPSYVSTSLANHNAHMYKFHMVGLPRDKGRFAKSSARLYCCEHCKFKTIQKAFMISHQLNVHMMPRKCKYCDFVCFSKLGLDTHYFVGHPSLRRNHNFNKKKKK